MQTWWSFLKRRGMSFDRVLGVDESGRGPLAGPVVVAGVLLPKHHGIKGLNDCKLLTEKRRNELYEEIIKLSEDPLPYFRSSIPLARGTSSFPSRVQVFVEQASAAEIDREGILNCTRKLMKRVVKAANPDIALLDAVNVDLYNVLQFALTKGDQRVDCIAAASIVTKVTRDRLMLKYDQKYPGYGLAEHKGYGTKQHRKAIAEKGLSRIHRKSFCRFSNSFSTKEP